MDQIYKIGGHCFALPDERLINNTVTVLTPKQLKNANLKWEGSSTINLGVDLGDVYKRQSQKQSRQKLIMHW